MALALLVRGPTHLRLRSSTRAWCGPTMAFIHRAVQSIEDEKEDEDEEDW
jgi:hypothetical protein